MKIKKFTGLREKKKLKTCIKLASGDEVDLGENSPSFPLIFLNTHA